MIMSQLELTGSPSFGREFVDLTYEVFNKISQLIRLSGVRVSLIETQYMVIWVNRSLTFLSCYVSNQTPTIHLKNSSLLFLLFCGRLLWTEKLTRFTGFDSQANTTNQPKTTTKPVAPTQDKVSVIFDFRIVFNYFKECPWRQLWEGRTDVRTGMMTVALCISFYWNKGKLSMSWVMG